MEVLPASFAIRIVTQDNLALHDPVRAAAGALREMMDLTTRLVDVISVATKDSVAQL